MIEKGKISSMQMAIIMYPTILATGILLVPAITAKFAQRDMWLSPVWASLIGIFTVIIACRLNHYYPKETIIEYSKHIIGTFPAKIVGLLYLFFYLHDTGIVIREYGEFVSGNFLERTPPYVVMGSIVLVCAFNVRSGLEVIGRSALIFVPLVILLFTCIIILLLPDLKPSNMLPIFEHGLGPSLKGSLVPQGWFTEFILISFMLPYLSNRKKAMKWGIFSVVSVMATMTITNLVSLFLFGDITKDLTYPVMVAARYIRTADFFEHLESLVMAIWVAGTFVKISMFYYATVLVAGQWIGLSSYRRIVLPIGLILIVFAYWLAPNLQELIFFLGTSSPFYYLSVQTLFPLLLLCIAFVQHRVRKKGGQPAK